RSFSFRYPECLRGAFRSRYPSLGTIVTELTSMTIPVSPEHAGKRLDQFLATALGDVSRARVQELISAKKVLIGGDPAKASLKLRGGEQVSVVGPAARAPLRAIPEDIALDIVFEDEDLAVID